MTMGAMAIIPDDLDELVRQARSDAAALGRLYDRYYPRILRYCVHRLFLREPAEDVTGAVFLDVARQIRDFSGATEADFANWLYAIASNHVAAWVRSHNRRRKLLEAAAREGRIRVSDPARDPAELDWPRLYAALADLSERDQAIVTLRSFEAMPFERIATVLNIKPTAARVAYHRALEKLRVQLADSFGRT